MKGLIFQILATVIMCYSCMGLGMAMAWPSSTLLLFFSENTTLHRPMTEVEGSLLGSLSSIGALLGNPFIAVLMDRIGRKYCTIIPGIMLVLAWVMIAISNRVEMILAANLVIGLSSSIFLVSPVFIAEICQQNIRGTMTSLVIMFYGLGMLISNLLGSCLSYDAMIYVFLVMAGCGFAFLFLLRESPIFLMQKGREKEAKRSLAFYKGEKVNSKEVLEEMEKIRRALNPEMDETSPETTPEAEKLNPDLALVPVKKPTLIQFLRKSRSSRRAMIMLFVLMTASIMQGLAVVMIYAKPLFDKIIPADVMSSGLCSVLLCAVSVVSSMVSGYLTDKAGRRSLLIIASILTGISCVIVGSLITFEFGPQWLIAVFIYLYTAVCTCGGGTIPYILVAEVLLPEIKSYVSMIVLEWAWICNFCTLYIFQPAVAAMGIGPVFYVFGVISFLTAVYSFFYVPETKGLSVDVIQTRFLKQK